VDLEPVGASAVPRTTLGHSHHQTLPQPTRLTRCPVLLVDDTLAVVLALRDGARVVIRPTEERLKQTRPPDYTSDSICNKTLAIASCKRNPNEIRPAAYTGGRRSMRTHHTLHPGGLCSIETRSNAYYVSHRSIETHSAVYNGNHRCIEPRSTVHNANRRSIEIRSTVHNGYHCTI
jgi:hypothetical protein